MSKKQSDRQRVRVIRAVSTDSSLISNWTTSTWREVSGIINMTVWVVGETFRNQAHVFNFYTMLRYLSLIWYGDITLLTLLDFQMKELQKKHSSTPSGLWLEQQRPPVWGGVTKLHWKVLQRACVHCHISLWAVIEPIYSSTVIHYNFEVL